MARNHTFALAASALLAHALTGVAQTYPVKPVRVIVPFAAGSGSDGNVRFYGEFVVKRWGQSLIIENRPGADGAVAAQIVKGAAPDGYTLLIGSSGPLTVNPVTTKNLPYSTLKDFRPVILFGLGTVAYVTGAATPQRTVSDFIADAKRAGASMQVGTYSPTYEIACHWLGIAAGVGMTVIPYKGLSAVVTELAGRQIPLGAIEPSGALPLIKDGRLRAIAIATRERHALLPDTPTLIESGFPDMVSHTWASIVAPRATSTAVVNRIHEGFRAAMMTPEGRNYRSGRVVVEVDYTPDEFEKFIVTEMDRFRKVAQLAGIQPK